MNDIPNISTAWYEDGDGASGTRYALHFSWWKLTYTAHSEVTDVAADAYRLADRQRHRRRGLGGRA